MRNDYCSVNHAIEIKLQNRAAFGQIIPPFIFDQNLLSLPNKLIALANSQDPDINVIFTSKYSKTVKGCSNKLRQTINLKPSRVNIFYDFGEV